MATPPSTNGTGGEPYSILKEVSMTEEEYLKRKPEIEAQYKLIDDKMDELGFGGYNDGSGDFGTRRYCKSGPDTPAVDGEMVWVVMIMDMYQEYWTNEYPDAQFYGKTNHPLQWVDIETPEELVAFISKEENHSFKINLGK